MHKKILIFFIFFSSTLMSFPSKTEEINFSNLPYKKNIKERILSGDVFSESMVKSDPLKNQQNLHFSIVGWHPKSCHYALKTLSRYEDYSKFIDFVKSSSYDDKTQTINFFMKHFLLPYDMSLSFVLPRINTTGTYPFKFEIGPLTGLNGKIHVINHKERCLFYSYANWSGPHTGFPNIVFELFSQTLSKLSMELLFRISSTLSH